MERIELRSITEHDWNSDVGIIATDATARMRGVRMAPVETLPNDPVAFARGLYAALYHLERAGVRHLVLEDVPHTPAWNAVRDRLLRAAER